MAWLNTAPETDHKGKGRPPEPISRLKSLRDRGERVILPHNPANYLTDWLFEIGPTSPGAMGEGPIGWQDMAAWEQLVGVELMPWEGKLLRRLSQAFLSQRYDAKKSDCPAPYSDTVVDESRDRVAEQFAAMMKGSLAKKAG